MTAATSPKDQDIRLYLKAQETKSLLRFITCGSVDDGKSTLIGRLLYDSKLIFDDHLAALRADSNRLGNGSEELNLALLVDGLAAEREQGITIDVAYRYFATETRKFVVADTPGHEQYTRNMATGASTAQLAVILIDARKGILTQTRRHSYITSLLGIRHVILAINKMDLVDYSQARFQQITDDYSLLADQLGFAEFTSIPISALNGDNIIHPSTRMSWYDGPTLIHQLESIDVSSSQAEKAMRMPVQWVNRANADFRGYSGTLASGIANVGDRVVVLPGARTTTIQSIVTAEGNLASALPEQAITICLEDAIDISRGDVIAAAESRPEVTDQFEASVVWMHEDPMLPGRPYLIRTENKTVPAVVTRLKYRVNINNYKDEPAEALALNEVGLCNFSLSEPIAFDPYRENRVMGSFIIIDRVSNNTIGCGMINHGLRRAQNIHWQAVDIDKQARAGAKQQRPALLWFTGLSGSGKSSIANLVEKKLFALGKHSYLLDGDNVRHGLNRDLGFTDVDRVENIRRIAETGKLMIDAGLIVLTSFISPFQAERSLARNLLEAGEFIEIFVDTPIEVCEARDPKGLYQKVRKGELKNFTGFDSPYETPENAEIHIRTVDESAEDAAERIVTYLLAQEKL